jgi:putative sterol carrier protein
MTVRVRLEGDGGGAWDLRVAPAGITIAAGSADEADITLVQSVPDWRAVVVGEPGAPSLAPAAAGPTDMLMLDAGTQQVLAAARGAIRLEVTGYNGRTWMLTIKLGPQPLPPEPNATVTVDAETYAGMVAKTIPPAQAFFSGKVVLGGDTALAMQLGMAMMQRFAA